LQQPIIGNQKALAANLAGSGLADPGQGISYPSPLSHWLGGEGYLSYLSLEYDLVLSRKQFFHRMLTMINYSSPRIMEKVFQTLSLTRDMMNIGKQNKLS